MHRAPLCPPEPTRQTDRGLFGTFVYTALISAVIWTISYPTTAVFIVGTLLALWVAVRFGRPVVQSARIGGSEPAVPATSEVNR